MKPTSRSFTSARVELWGEPVQFGNDPNLMPGGEHTYQSYGTAWANLSNTPFRLYKINTHQGGHSVPFIVSWPDGLDARGEFRLANVPGVARAALHARRP